MRNKLVRRIRKLLPCSVCRSNSPKQGSSVDLCEEYANAFRTESYIDFWTRVLAYSNNNNNNNDNSLLSTGSTTSTRLPSYRLFAEYLLDPDQPTVTRILSQAHFRPIIHSLLFHYFAHTSNAFLLCSHLLNDIQCVRLKFHNLNTILQCLATNHVPNNFSFIISHLTEFSNFLNPFAPSSPFSSQVRLAQCQCFELQKRLESSRDKAQAKLKLISTLKYGSSCLVVGITSSLVVIMIATHGLALLMAMPGLVTATSMNMASERKLARVMAQLDAAAKGTYILNKDLETISRLVARLNDELEHVRTTMKFWLERKHDKVQANGEMASLVKKNQCSFGDQLDELEEHLYLCFMTINRARDLVLKQISGQA
ncbi:hypothetical protein Lalb_Chr02g0141191 [Lupinus albus]|uniref:Uncharacterized protein n=1 Tax=Lupinus albus TaxID=3870 RepID=A0A6A4QZ43_LUPAL|nr:hypothetical protein Lalb_Chr02g0141191 [Lupinus albus]